jgi:hypothetical protein
MKIFSFIALSLFLFCISAAGQIRVEGHITGNNSSEGELLPLANVILWDRQDTSQIAYATMTDLQGDYSFENVIPNQYLIEISYLGYKPVREIINVSFPSVGRSLRYDYELEPMDDIQLAEVAVTASSIKQHIDKTTYLISSEDIKSARFSLDLLEKIPDLTIDPVSQRLKNAKGSTKILIDGVSAGEIDLKAIPANKIAQMEYYDIPPARYMSYASVVNVITKNVENGFAAGATLQQAFTTGFANDDVFFKYNRGKNQFSLDYTLNYRNYKQMEQTTVYSYLFHNEEKNRKENVHNAFGYDDHFINLKYKHQMKDNYLFQLQLSPNFSNKRSKDNVDIQLANNATGSDRQGNKTDGSRIRNPFLNVYYWKQLSNQQELTIDVVASAFSTDQQIRNKEFSQADHSLALEDYMDLENQKKSLIGEVAYNKTVAFSHLNAGYKIETYDLFSKINNRFDNVDYKSSYLSNYVYGEVDGSINGFMYRISLGVRHKQNRTYNNKYATWTFIPILVGGYRINSQNSIRLIYTQVPVEPGISELSNNVIYVTDNIVKKGNPLLKNSLAQFYSFNYRFAGTVFNFSLDALYAYSKNPVNTYYFYSEETIALVSVNDISAHTYGLSYSGSVKPFGNDLLTLTLNGEILNNRNLNMEYGSMSYIYAPLWYNISLKYKNWLLNYQGNIAGKDLSGAFLQKDENNSHITARYTKNNFSVSASLLWAFTVSKYATESISKSIVKYSNHLRIHDNANMFTLGLTYTFHSGKKYDEQEKKINNRDTDSGLFK